MFRFLLLASLTALLVGCGQAGDRCYPVRGKVLLDNGSPLIGARVSFESTSKQISAEGYTDSQGNFVMTTNATGDGALAGEHRIIVTPPPQKQQTSQQRYAEVSQFEGVTAEDLEAIKNAPPPSLIDPKYADFATSGLIFVVEPNGNNQCDLTVQRRK